MHPSASGVSWILVLELHVSWKLHFQWPPRIRCTLLLDNQVQHKRIVLRFALKMILITWSIISPLLALKNCKAENIRIPLKGWQSRPNLHTLQNGFSHVIQREPSNLLRKYLALHLLHNLPIYLNLSCWTRTSMLLISSFERQKHM